MQVASSRHPAVDARGRDLQLGDWVRVLQAPISIVGMPAESLAAFSSAIGLTLQVLSFDETGCLELHLHQKRIGWDTVWLEPFCVERSRRPRSPGRYFTRYRTWLEKVREREASES